MWSRLEVVAVLTASFGVTLAALSGPGSEAVALPSTSGGSVVVEVSFQNDILPILEESCVQCHGGEDENGREIVEAGLYLMTYEQVMQGSEFGSVVDPGDLESMLYVLVSEGDMPDGDEKLSDEQIKLIGDWIMEGAKNN